MATPSLVRWMLLGLGGGAVLAGAYLFAPDLRRAVRVAPDAAVAPPRTASQGERSAAAAAASAPEATAAPPRAAAAPQQMAASPPAAGGSAAASGAPAAATGSAAGPGAIAPPGPRLGDPPRFDVVRVGARGIAVIAGRAQPGAEVVLSDEGREIGRARADARGEWVILPAEPLRPGTHALRLRARLAGEEVAGPDTVAVLVPEPGAAVAAASAMQGGQQPEQGPPPAGGALAGGAAAPGGTETSSATPPAARSPVPNPPPNFAARDGAAAAPGAAGARAAGSVATAEAGAQAGGDAALPPSGLPGSAATPGASGPPAAAGTPFAVLLPPPAPLAGAPGSGGPDAAMPRVLQAPSGGPAPAEAASAGQAVSPPRTGGAAAPPRLALEAVEYDDSGAMRFTGAAAPGAAVRIYVDQRHAGDARADAAGRWMFLATEPPSYGVHTLRLDQVAASGSVAARIELPFQRDRAPPAALARRAGDAPAAASPVRTHAASAGNETTGSSGVAAAAPSAPVTHAGRVVVQPGHNLWRIARETYGQGVRYTIIYRANRDQIRDPDLIYPGQIFALPDPEPASPMAGQPAPAESSRSR